MSSHTNIILHHRDSRNHDLTIVYNMTMRAIWDGSINFGLVNIPVRMYSGSDKHEGIGFDMLRERDHSPIHYKRVADDGHEVPYEDIVKGYEYQKGEYVVVTAEDFDKANAHKTQNITIKQFVQSGELDSRYFDKPYYLEPDENANETYHLLREALDQTDRIAIASFVLHGRESLAAIEPIGNILVLNQLRWPADLRDPAELNVGGAKIGKTELSMAIKLINQHSKPFDPKAWHDTYTEELKALIDHKLKGKKITTASPPARPTTAKDLAQTLKDSLAHQ